MTPKAMPDKVTSHIPVASRKSRSAGQTAFRPWGLTGSGAGAAKAATMRAPPATEAAENVAPVPIWFAIPPTTGPNSWPTTAAPTAVPSSSPRLSSGVTVVSQAKPAAQMHDPATPCTNRAASSATAVDVQRGPAHERQSEQCHPPFAQPGGKQTGWNRTDERPGRIGGDQDPRVGFGHACRLFIMRQE